MRSHSQTESNTGHSDLLRGVVRYSVRARVDRCNRRASRPSLTKTRNRLVSTEFEIGNRDMKWL